MGGECVCMTDETGKIKAPHSLVLEDRKKLTLSGVTDVDSFDETMITAYTDYGELTISGSSLHICKLSIDDGELCVEGLISAMTYIERQPKAQGLFGKIFK